MARPESEFPTISDLHDRLTELISYGLGDLPVQVLIVPDSTMQAVAKVTAPPGYDVGGKPALLIEFDAVGGRLPVSLVSTDRMTRDGGMPTTHTQ
jgi:hypothetical protein